MTDEEYIRKAVELAHGRWEISDLTGNAFVPPFYNSSYPLNTLEQWHLDALAAQLVRQVDALAEQIHEVDISKGEVWVGTCDSYDGIKGIAKVRGPDRTMNTIKAIVDSKALEGGEK